MDSKIPSKIRDLKITRRERVFGGPLKDAVKNRNPKVPFGKDKLGLESIFKLEAQILFLI